MKHPSPSSYNNSMLAYVNRVTFLWRELQTFSRVNNVLKETRFCYTRCRLFCVGYVSFRACFVSFDI